MSTATHLAELTAIYEEELARYTDFLRSARQLTETLKANAAEAQLSELFTEQSELIAKINNLDRAARELKSKLAAELGVDEVSVSVVSGLPGAVEFETVLQKLAALLLELQTVEQENTALLEARLKNLVQKRQVPPPKRSIRLAYRKRSESDDSAIDKKR